MKIVHIVPGSGKTFYCQNCLRDASLVAALRQAGHDAMIVPMYLPLFTDRADLTVGAPVFYGAVNAYLKEYLPLFRRLPRRLAALLDASPILRYAARKAGSTRAHGLEQMTLSVLRGEQGNQADELARLVQWLSTDSPPDIIHLSNALLAGMAGPLRRELGVPVVCSLQDEDGWIDAMAPADRDRVWQVMAEKAADVDAFAAVSRHYAATMQDRLAIPAARMHVVHIGLRPEEYQAGSLPFDPPVIGFLSRTSPSLGLDILVQAVLLLKKESQLRALRLAAMGGTLGDDARFLRRLARDLAAQGINRDFSFLPEFGHTSRLEFLRSISVLSVPVPQGEAFGIYLIEAMASGVPVVQPRLGAFPEIVETAGGGVLYAPNTPEALANAIRPLLADPAAARALGARGRAGVARHFTVKRMADEMAELYRKTTTT